MPVAILLMFMNAFIWGMCINGWLGQILNGQSITIFLAFMNGLCMVVSLSYLYIDDALTKKINTYKPIFISTIMGLGLGLVIAYYRDPLYKYMLSIPKQSPALIAFQCFIISNIAIWLYARGLETVNTREYYVPNETVILQRLLKPILKLIPLPAITIFAGLITGLFSIFFSIQIQKEADLTPYTQDLAYLTNIICWLAFILLYFLVQFYNVEPKTYKSKITLCCLWFAGIIGGQIFGLAKFLEQTLINLEWRYQPSIIATLTGFGCMLGLLIAVEIYNQKNRNPRK